MFEKILIASRGELAVRIARTCERMGIHTVAIHSEIESRAMHVEICSEAVCVDAGPAADAYLNANAILEAAQKTGAQAVHPGYGKLAENTAFARALAEAKIVFVGPPADTLETYRDKLRSRELARLAGVRCVPGSEDAVTALSVARAQAEELGYPIMVKAVTGGAGVAQKRVDDEDELEAALSECRAQALEAFGDERVYIEAYVEQARHIEVQLLLDTKGQCATLGERECSIQREHRKVIGEAPSPGLSALGNGELKRLILLDSAARIAKEGGYVNAGTAEFLLDAAGALYFLEWSPRLQVEHAVTEMCTGLDLVEHQLRVAGGEELTAAVTRAPLSGHAMEARIYAEPASGDAGSDTGSRTSLQINSLRWPTVAPGALRVETGFAAGDELLTEYDPLIAKMVAYGQTRHQTLLTLDRVLAETVVEPISTNLTFLRRVLADESFRAGQYDCDLIQRLNHS